MPKNSPACPAQDTTDEPLRLPAQSANANRSLVSVAANTEGIPSSPYILYTASFDSPFSILNISPNVEDILGYSPKDIIQDCSFWDTHWHPSDQEMKKFRRYLFRSSRHTALYRFQHRDGSWRILRDEMTLAPASADYAQAGHKHIVSGIITDVTCSFSEPDESAYSPSLFSAIFESSPSGLFVLDMNGKFLDANQAGLELYKASYMEIVGKYPRELCNREDGIALQDAIRRASELGTTQQLERTQRRLDGTRFWADLRINPIFDTEGHSLFTVVSVTDLTRQRKQQLALEEAENEKNKILSTVTELMLHQDLSHRILWANSAATQSINKSSEQIVGDFCYKLWAKRRTPCPDCPVHEAIETGHTCSGVVKRAHDRTWHITAYPLNDSTGKPTGALQVARDITDQRATEEALRKSESEKQLILSTISESVTHLRPDGTVIWGNPATVISSGSELSKMVGKKCYTLFSGQTKPCKNCPLPETLKKKTQARGEVTHPNGTIWEVACYPILDSKKDITSIIKVSREITKSKKLEKNLRKARDLAENANKMKTEFLANMSHELRSPLNGVLGMLDCLLDTKLDAEQKDCTEIALQAGEGLLTIINDILDFSKLQADKITLSHNEFDLRQTMRVVTNTFVQQCRTNAVELSYSVDNSIPPQLIGDEGRVRQILFNLIGNAVKFTKNGSVDVSVNLLHKETAPQQARLLVEVADTGIGIPKEQKESIFDPFVQLNWGKHSKYEGTGLGLGIVKRLVSRMGGIINVESEPGKGTTVSFWITVGLVQPNSSPQLTII